MENKINYLNNGRSSQNSLIYSTKLSNIKNQSSNNKNGKLFIKEMTNSLQKANLEKQNNNDNNSITAWVLNTLNPLNHIPVVSSIHKLANTTSKSLDMVQSAIGGAIYGGGPVGLAKGLGSWFVNKLLPKNLFAESPKDIKEFKKVESNLNSILNEKNQISKSQKNIDIITSKYFKVIGEENINKNFNTKNKGLLAIENYKNTNNFQDNSSNKNLHQYKIDVDA
jgi:hypothetical protein